MVTKKDREAIPPEVAAKVLFLSDRTCCVCRTKGKPVQIHHIDENPANNDLSNLSVLCFDCHTETQIRGGFHRKLDAEQIVLYRNDWVSIIARSKAGDANRAPDDYPEAQAVDLELATTIAEIYGDKQEYELLAMHYLGIGNDELRDKYINLAMNQGVDDDTHIFFRGVQNRLDLLPQDVIDRRIATLKKQKDWLQLGRLYRTLGDSPASASSICLGAIEAIKRGNIFSAAYYLKEMMEEGTIDDLFIEALKKASEEGDLWWQYRSLQELGWDSEAHQLLLDHKEEIENDADSPLLEYLLLALGNTRRYVEVRKDEARSISAKVLPEQE